MRMMWMTMLLGGCLSVRQGQTARPLGAGNAEVALDGGVLLFPEAGGVAGGLVTANIGVRYGVGKRIDLLGEIGNLGVGLGFKAALTPEDSPVAVALAPRINGGTVILFSFGQLSLPVLVGIPLGEHEITFSPRADLLAGAFVVSDVGATGSLWFVGGTTSVSLKAGPVRFAPEVGFIRALRGSVATLDDGEANVNVGAWLIQPNLFVAFDVGG